MLHSAGRKYIFTKKMGLNGLEITQILKENNKYYMMT